jgi:hypothetical protein
MMIQASKQASTSAKGRRHNDEVLVRFAMNLWIMAGRRTYEILYSNLPGIFPTSRLVQIKLTKFQMSVVEGNRPLNNADLI